ncbi:MAG: hypothetical protein J5988_06710, partial [Eubacterium sp.]|nr:hypothetical protein [Eubacterium sp.]
LITIVNWEKYQGKDYVSNKDANKDLTKSQQRANKDLTTNKNDKEYKNDKEEKNKPAALSLTEEEEHIDLWNED